MVRRLGVAVLGLVLLGVSVAVFTAPCPSWLRWTGLLFIGSLGVFTFGLALTAPRSTVDRFAGELRDEALHELTLGLYVPDEHRNEQAKSDGRAPPIANTLDGGPPRGTRPTPHGEEPSAS